MGPEGDFGVGCVDFEEREQTRRVRDIADVFNLPAVAQEEARKARRCVGIGEAGERGGGGARRSYLADLPAVAQAARPPVSVR